MIYSFDDFELDIARAELRRDGLPVSVEPQVFDLLALLVANSDRLVTREELVDTVWDGRIVSESAIDSRIRSVRRVLDDSGTRQRYIKTIRGKGLRFVGQLDPDRQDAKVGKPNSVYEAGETGDNAFEKSANSRPSIAVLPFNLVGVAGPYGQIADALASDLITELSRLRLLFVIARGSSFRFRGTDIDVCEVGRQLGVRYCLSGTTEVYGDTLIVNVELSDASSSVVIWADRQSTKVDYIHESRQKIVSSVIAALETHIAEYEAISARMRAPENLDTWSSYHVGIHHMYRFTKSDNEVAGRYFQRAIDLEPDFARAHSGMSFVHFQNAFLHYKPETKSEADLARRFAEMALELDSHDPSAHMNMGRSMWLTDEIGESPHWLDRATRLNPNYAQSIYSQAWINIMLGNGEIAQTHADLAMSLSPLDPLYYAMSAARSMSHTLRGQYQQAAQWGEIGAQSPGAHIFIEMIALAAHYLNNNEEKTKIWLARVLKRNPAISHQDFFIAFPFQNPEAKAVYTRALVACGL